MRIPMITAAVALTLLQAPSLRPSFAANPPSTQPAADGAQKSPDSPDVKQAQVMLSQAAQAAFTPSQSAKLVSFLAKHNRDKIGNSTAWPDVDEKLKEFRQKWQGKYGQELNLTDKQSTLFVEPGVKFKGAGEGENEKTLAVFHGDAEAKGLTLTIVREGGDKYFIDLPGDRSADDIRKALLARLTKLNASQNDWPTDLQQAYAYAAHQVLSAIADEKPMATDKATK